jgi:putative photosynthetic complex assembly protein 2
MQIVWAVLYAIILWWVSTGAIIVMYRKEPWTYDATVGAYTVVAAASLVVLVMLRHTNDLWAVYASFSAGTLLWGWNLACYYTGYITGPKAPLHDGTLSDAERFRHAMKRSAHHEWVSVVLVAASAGLAWGATNSAGFGCIILFYTLHMLAKLSIYFGVANFSGAWLPAHLQYITAYFGPRQFHWFSLCAIGLGVVGTVWCIAGVVSAQNVSHTVTYAFWGLICAAAVLELVVLLIPEPQLHRFLAFLTHLSGAANTKML